MVSILVPSRGRPSNIKRLYESLEATTQGKWELLVRCDDDDPTWDEYAAWVRQTSSNLSYLITSDRRLLSQLWNELVPYSQGDILMHGGDDIIFNTPGWDKVVREAFPPDGIAFVHGDDLGGKGDKLGTHGFLSRKAIDAVGYFMPPYFASDYNDLWWNEVYESIGRRIFVPIVTEHLHFAFGKGEMDQTHVDRITRHEQEDVDKVWVDTEPQRVADAAKLHAIIAG